MGKRHARTLSAPSTQRGALDGGNVDALACLEGDLDEHGVGADSNGDVWLESYTARVEADGGSVEGCADDDIDALGAKDFPDDAFSLYWFGYLVTDLVSIEDEASQQRWTSLR